MTLSFLPFPSLICLRLELRFFRGWGSAATLPEEAGLLTVIKSLSDTPKQATNGETYEPTPYERDDCRYTSFRADTASRSAEAVCEKECAQAENMPSLTK
jgi:hypothetical protein